MKFIGGLLIWIISFIVLCVPLAILTLVKLLITLYNTKIKNRVLGSDNNSHDELFGLDPEDAMFPTNSSWVKPTVNFGFCLMMFDEDGKSFSVDELRKHFYNCFLDKGIEGGKYDKLSSYLIVKSGCVFRAVKENIDLADHIYEVNLKDGTSLEEYVAEWLLSGYQEKKPCWEMILISLGPSPNQKSDQGRTALAFKIHHGLCDGYSIIHILDRLTGNTSPYLVKDFKEGLGQQIKQMIEVPMNFGLLKALPPQMNPFRVTPNPEGHEWMLSFTTFSLDELKEIRRKYDVHMSSVLASIITGSLREFLEKEVMMKEEDLPEKILFAKTLPWPRHPSRNPSIRNRDRLCNHWVSAVSLKVLLAERDPVVRLKQIEDELKMFYEAGIDKFFKRIVFPITWTIAYASLGEKMSEKDMGIVGGITSLLGGDNYEILGRPIHHIQPYLAVHDNNNRFPLSCFTFSHSGKMDVTFGAHPSVFKDQKSLDTMLHEYAHNEMKILLSQARSVE